MSEFDWQCHNWYHFTWLSGDQICEQHIHNIDVLNGASTAAKKFTAVGGRAAATTATRPSRSAASSPEARQAGRKYNGDIWDHVFAEFEYPNGARCLSFSGHSPGSGRNGEKIVGTKGTSDCANRIFGENAWSYQGPGVNGQDQEHIDLIQSIRAGKPINHGQRIARAPSPRSPPAWRPTPAGASPGTG